MLRILRGEANTVAEISDSWQEYIGSMAFFAKPFQLKTHSDVQQLYRDANRLGFNIDSTLSSEIASAALFTGDIPRVYPS
jgi:Nup85 Nucleoporin